MTTTEQIIANAKYAKNAVVELESKLKNGWLLWEYFHLRPTASGIAVISNRPRYPMYGAAISADALQEKLLELDGEAVRLLAAADPDEAQKARLAEVMDRFGFQSGRAEPETSGAPRRQSAEHIQASFISGMIRGGAEYAGVSFLASELALEEDSPEPRFDAVGYKDGTLYLFALKKSAEAEAYGQIERYRACYEAHAEDYAKLLAAYPRTACRDMVSVHYVRYVAVLKYAADSTADWQKKSDAAKADTWFFEPALAFRKVIAK